MTEPTADDMAWHAAQEAGLRAYHGFKAQNWPEGDCLVAAISAAMLVYELAKAGPDDD